MTKLKRWEVILDGLLRDDTQWKDPDGEVCLDTDVAELESKYEQLEASRAELMEALKEIVQQTDGRNHSILGQDRAYSIARAAIAKAEGEVMP